MNSKYILENISIWGGGDYNLYYIVLKFVERFDLTGGFFFFGISVDTWTNVKIKIYARWSGKEIIFIFLG